MHSVICSLLICHAVQTHYRSLHAWQQKQTHLEGQHVGSDEPRSTVVSRRVGVGSLLQSSWPVGGDTEAVTDRTMNTTLSSDCVWAMGVESV